MDDHKHIGLIGVGLMGTAIAERLLEHGYKVSVWNRTREKAEALIAEGAIWSNNPLADCRRSIISLYSSGVVSEVMNQMAEELSSGTILIDTTTGDPSDAVSFADRFAQHNTRYLDAPISGSSLQTRRGEATVMVGGDSAAFHACDDLWPILGNRVFYTGISGSAAKVKLVTNLVLGLNRVALAEGLMFAEATGIRPEIALEVLQSSAAYSKAMDVKGRKMVEGDFQVQARLSQHYKDVRLILESATMAGLDLPLTTTHAGLLAQAEEAGYGQLDNSAIINVYRKRNQ